MGSSDLTPDPLQVGQHRDRADLLGHYQGAVLRLLTTERNSTEDVPEWLEKAGHELLAIEEKDDHWRIDVRKA